MKPDSRWTKLTLVLLHPRLTGVQLIAIEYFHQMIIRAAVWVGAQPGVPRGQGDGVGGRHQPGPHLQQWPAPAAADRS